MISTCALSSTLPNDFIAASHTAHLSRLATSTTQHLPRQIWMAHSRASSLFGGLLQLNLTCLPDSLLSKANGFTGDQCSILFNLVVIHTLVSLHQKMGNDLAPVHYSNLIASTSRLVSMIANKLDISTILHFLLELVVNLYSSCLQKERVLSLAEQTLTLGHCTPDTEFEAVPGVKVTVPTTATQPGKFASHVEKTIAPESYSNRYSVIGVAQR